MPDSDSNPKAAPRFAGPHPKSRLYQNSESVDLRLVINGDAFLLDQRASILSARALGVLMRLLPHTCHRGFSFNGPDVRLGRLGGVSERVIRSVWPEIEQFFFVYDGKAYLHEQPWLTVIFDAGRRVSLRGYTDTLIEFWGAACVYCGVSDESLHIEHIIPRARGGSDQIGNLTLSCAACNARKGTRTAAEFGFPQIHERARGLE